MAYRPCRHGCSGGCITRRGAGCAPTCHPESAYTPPPPGSPAGRYLALLQLAHERLSSFARQASPAARGPR